MNVSNPINCIVESIANVSVNCFSTNASNIVVVVNSSCMNPSIVKLNDCVARRYASTISVFGVAFDSNASTTNVLTGVLLRYESIANVSVGEFLRYESTVNDSVNEFLTNESTVNDFSNVSRR